MRIQIPYGKETLEANVEDKRVVGVINSKLDTFSAGKGEHELISDAMQNPIGTAPLCELAKGKSKVVIIASDHTRPVPSKLIIPDMLREIRKTNPRADITILIATGCHRSTRKEELYDKFGEELVKKEKIIIHDCDSTDMKYLGKLPSGGELWINRLAAEADLLIAEGFIEPHFFAGYSGGRKSVLPGISRRDTIYANHCAEFIEDPNSRYGQIKDNLIHRDMIYAAHKARLAYILNVVINSAHKVIGAFAGDVELAHKEGVMFLESLCKAGRIPADIVVASNNGYPMDQNIYQTVKGMAAAEKTVKTGGVIIMAAACDDGCGGDAFYKIFSHAQSAQDVLDKILKVPRHRTQADQWQAQIMARILSQHAVILISKCPEKMVKNLHIVPAFDFKDALAKADRILGFNNGTITFIPEGITSIIQ